MAARRLAPLVRAHGDTFDPTAFASTPITFPITAGAVVYAVDVPRLTEFYATVVGLNVTSSAQDHAILESGAFQLVIHTIPADIAPSIEIARPPIRREETPVKLVFLVASISVARALATAHGGQVDPTEREWMFGPYRVCDGHDPEGNVIQLRQTAV